MGFKAFKPSVCRRAFKRKGFIEDKKRDHCYYYLIIDSKRSHIYTKISHTNKKDISRYILSKMARDLYVNNNFLTDFINCDKLHEDLVDQLRDQGII